MAQQRGNDPMIANKRLAQLTLDSYHVTPDITGDHDAARAVIHRQDGYCVVAFPGTRPERLWDDIADLDARPKSIPRIGPVHTGFWDAMLSVADQIDKATAGEHLIICGHSLGGAIGLDLAAYRILNGKPVWGVATWGAPRVSKGPFLGYTLAATTATLYRRASDPVPHLPWNILPTDDWRHPRDLTQLGADDHEFEWADIEGSVRRQIGDHAMDLYVQDTP